MLSSFHNPDILTCLANLSSDEVFTPPSVANQMLDTLPDELWSDKTVAFLDPASKSGVFLREITKRLLKGLKTEIPDIKERLEHILKNQVFGIGITELTSEISRRTLYCSRKANGKYSIVNFNDDEGNLRYFESQHCWADGVACKYCGINKKLHRRDKGLESYAYSFIHEDRPKELFNMKFDVIVGNPPYQMSTGGSKAQATPLYDKFISQAKKLSPRFMTMIIPARWYSGGFGLNDFRRETLNDKRFRKLVDFTDASDCFPGTQIKGGVCYFLWERDSLGKCEITNVFQGEKISMERYLVEPGLKSFIRYNPSISILNKTRGPNFIGFDSLVSSQKPFGLPTNYKISKEKKGSNTVIIYGNKQQGYIEPKEIPINFELVNHFKIFISAGYGAGEGLPHQIINKPFIGRPNSCCTETYVLIGPFNSEEESNLAISYMKTKFFRFMVMLMKNSQHALKNVYSLVPVQEFDKEWTDKILYQKYNLTEDEIRFIEKMIRPIE
jgi:site-specific DNA-methyltransferase (adenine-specific)